MCDDKNELSSKNNVAHKDMIEVSVIVKLEHLPSWHIQQIFKDKIKQMYHETDEPGPP